MGYAAIITGIVIFFASMALHVAVWRVFKPKSYFKALPAVFLALPAVIVLLCLFTGCLEPGGPLGFMDGPGWLAALLLDLALAGAYIMTYPALQASSPSLVVVMKVDDAMPRGLTPGELSDVFAAKGLVGERIEDLSGSGLIEVKGTACSITPRGRTLLRPFVVLRRLLGLPAGLG